MKDKNCGNCELLIDIDKSQDGGTCILDGDFYKFHNICIHKNISDENYKSNN